MLIENYNLRKITNNGYNVYNLEYKLLIILKNVMKINISASTLYEIYKKIYIGIK